MRRVPRVICALMAVWCSQICIAVAADDWPHWRGPAATGVSPETGLPVSWSKAAGVAWRAPLAGAGVSSPVVWRDQVYVTSQSGAGVRRAGSHPTLVQGAAAADSGERNLTGATADGTVAFTLAAYRWSDGKVAWRHDVPADGALPSVHDKHNLASPSPVTDADVVVGWFGTGQIVALDHSGKPLWAKHLGKEYAPFDLQWGHSSSPVLFKDLVILVCYHGTAAYVLALDKKTGAVRWKVDRPASLVSYSTPVVVEGARGPEILINTSTGLEAISAETGEDRWRVVEDNRFPIPVPTVADGMIYTTRGYRSGPYVAIRPGGQGDVTASHVAWRIPTGAPYISSLVHYQGLIYTAGELGVVTCLDAKTGERVWQERAGGVFTASPVAADGRIYLVSESGETVVLRAGRTFEILSRNGLDGHFVASPAISRGRIFLRGDTELFAVGK
jgi:outer membrane protein assembly factor BamB